MNVKINKTEENLNIFDISENNFANKVIEASDKQIILVDFWAPWCGPCKQLGPLLEEVIKECNGLVSLAKMNIDENNTLVWETGDNPPGEYMVVITASDGANDAIQVFSVFINSFPVITSPDSVTVSVKDTLKFQIKAHDPNPKDTLTFHLDTLYQN